MTIPTKKFHFLLTRTVSICEEEDTRDNFRFDDRVVDIEAILGMPKKEFYTPVSKDVNKRDIEQAKKKLGVLEKIALRRRRHLGMSLLHYPDKTVCFKAQKRDKECGGLYLSSSRTKSGHWKPSSSQSSAIYLGMSLLHCPDKTQPSKSGHWKVRFNKQAGKFANTADQLVRLSFPSPQPSASTPQSYFISSIIGISSVIVIGISLVIIIISSVISHRYILSSSVIVIFSTIEEENLARKQANKQQPAEMRIMRALGG
ncbi:5160_t:CDS:2 [Paraglomus occultum]|uniref:5160_t:CDS:1 n=1 Tax=Paraglomus occultum TaxID=144539 RepID=A0A9N9D6A8_9GLOM|nr:5160_t:CDS:2 [Paraglomus occultum]